MIQTHTVDPEGAKPHVNDCQGHARASTCGCLHPILRFCVEFACRSPAVTLVEILTADRADGPEPEIETKKTPCTHGLRGVESETPEGMWQCSTTLRKRETLLAPGRIQGT